MNAREIIDGMKRHPLIVAGAVGLVIVYVIYVRYVSGSSPTSGSAFSGVGGAVGATSTPTLTPEQSASYSLQAQQEQDSYNLQQSQLADETAIAGQNAITNAVTSYNDSISKMALSAGTVLDNYVAPAFDFAGKTINMIGANNAQTLASAASVATAQLAGANQLMASVAQAAGQADSGAQQTMTQINSDSEKLAEINTQANTSTMNTIATVAMVAAMAA